MYVLIEKKKKKINNTLLSGGISIQTVSYAKDVFDCQNKDCPKHSAIMCVLPIENVIFGNQKWEFSGLSPIRCRQEVSIFSLFVSLRPLNNLSVMRDGSSWVEPVLS